jgi:ADP-ribosylglycohydrolase
MDHPPHSPELAPTDFHLFLYLQKSLAGKQFDDYDDADDAVQKWLYYMRREYKNLHTSTSASTMAATMWKSSLKYVESNNKFFLQNLRK